MSKKTNGQALYEEQLKFIRFDKPWSELGEQSQQLLEREAQVVIDNEIANAEPFCFLDPETGDTCGSRSEVYHQSLFTVPQPLPSVDEIKKCLCAGFSAGATTSNIAAALHELIKGKS